MATKQIPTVNAVKEYHRKNSAPWQADLPYDTNNIVFASNGSIYKCILPNNETAPYDDPKDPSDQAFEGVYWELASGGGASESEYDVDFEVLPSERKVIAISEEGTIKIATKRNFNYRPATSFDPKTSLNYNGRYSLLNGDMTSNQSPYLIVGEDFILQGKGENTNEAVRSDASFTSESVLAFATPRPEKFYNSGNFYAETNGHVVTYDIFAKKVFVLKNGAINWSEVTNLTSYIGTDNTVIGGINGKFYIVLQSASNLLRIYAYDPSDDSVVVVDDNLESSDSGLISTKWVKNETHIFLVYRNSADTATLTLRIDPLNDSLTTWSNNLTLASHVNTVTPIGVKEGLVYVGLKNTTTEKYGIAFFDPDTGNWTIVSGGTAPLPESSQSSTSSQYIFYSTFHEKFFSHDDSTGSRRLMASSDFINWTSVSTPAISLPAFSSFRIFPMGDGKFVIATDFLHLFTTTSPEDYSLNFSVFLVSLIDDINRFKVLGISSNSKDSLESGKVSKIKVQKVSLLDGFVGLTTGKPAYLGEEGLITQNISSIQSGDYRVLLGYAVSTTEIDIQMGEPILNLPNEMLTDSVPIGTLLMMTGMDVPTGCLKADGGEYLRSVYPTLNERYAEQGYPYGAGDGSTTFNVPDFTKDGIVTYVVKARYISDTSLAENTQIDTRIKDLEDRQTIVESETDELNEVLKPVLETSSDGISAVDITPDQELFMDGTSSVVTSDGRKPISGMNLGTYIPPKIEIDGKWYDNPSVKMFDDRGCFAFFESWENSASWKNLDSYTLGTGSTVTQEGDWVKFLSTSVNGYVYFLEEAPLVFRRNAILIKKGNGDTFHIGASSVVGASAQYIWSTDTAIDGTLTSITRVVRLSDDLVYLEYKQESTGTASFLVNGGANEYFWYKNVVAVNDLEFIPPFGQDGNPKEPLRAYNFDKWDHPISFKFKPQFDYDTSNSYQPLICSFVGDNTNDTNEFFIYYRGEADAFAFAINVDDVWNTYLFGHNGTNWDVGQQGSALNPFTGSTNDILKQEHTLSYQINNESGTAYLEVDGDIVLNNQTIPGLSSSWAGSNSLRIGSFQIVGIDRFFDGYISNFCVHPKTASLPIDQSVSYKDPNKQYGKNAQWFLDQFGNFPGSSLLGGAGGIVEEGSNINGNWVVFENGLKIVFYSGLGYYQNQSAYGSLYVGYVYGPDYPIEFKTLLSATITLVDYGSGRPIGGPYNGAAQPLNFPRFSYYDVSARATRTDVFGYMAIGY